jgi:UrcA family protein
MTTLKQKSIFSLAAFAATFVAIGAAGDAYSQPMPENSVSVRTSDLNLTTASGRRTLDLRISAAARKVCGTGISTRLEAEQTRLCIDQTTQNAMEQVLRK